MRIKPHLNGALLYVCQISLTSRFQPKPSHFVSLHDTFRFCDYTKLQNKSRFQGSILGELMDFASSVPDFRRVGKGNIRHRMDDIIMLMILGRASGRVGRAEIIEFGRHNLGRFRKMGMLRNGVPSEATAEKEG